MALLLEKTLYNGLVVEYHRIGKYKFVSPTVVVALLESFRNRHHREFSFIPVTTWEIDFPFDGNVDTMPAQAYGYIKSLPEWANAVDC